MGSETHDNQQVEAATAGNRQRLPEIAGFEILDKLGTGGMSTVYRARQKSLDRIVAIKLLHKHLIYDKTHLKRFHQEARVAKLLEHRNIAGVYSFGSTDEDEPFIVMEYCQGQTLKEFLDECGTLRFNEISDIFGQICMALTHAHGHSIVHRDLKPSNVFLQDSETGKPLVKIIDFGIAKVLAELEPDAQRLTRTGMVLGSPHYMSPEQCRGGAVDARTDLYAVGCMLFEALSGKPPFDSDALLEVAAKHLADPIPSVSTVSSKRFPAEVERLIAKALAKKPEDRYQTAEELNDDLQGLQSAVLLPENKMEQRGFRGRFPLVIAGVACMIPAAVAAWLALQPRASGELEQAEKLLDSGNYMAAYPKLLSLQEVTFSNADAARLVDDLCDTALMVYEDQRQGYELNRSEPSPAVLAAHAAQDVSVSHPPNIQRARAHGVILQVTPNVGEATRLSEQWDNDLSKDDLRYEQGISKHRMACRLALSGPDWHDRTLAVFADSIRLLQRSNHPAALLSVLIDFGDYMEEQRQEELASGYYGQACEIASAAVQGNDRDTAFELVRLAKYAIKTHRHDLATLLLDRADEIYAAKPGSLYALAQSKIMRARLCRAQGNPDRAALLYNEAFNLMLKAPFLANASMNVLVDHACTLESLGKTDKATQELERVEQYFKQNPGWRRMDLCKISPVLLASLYVKQNRDKEALALYQQYLPEVKGMRNGIVSRGKYFYKQLLDGGVREDRRSMKVFSIHD